MAFARARAGVNGPGKGTFPGTKASTARLNAFATKPTAWSPAPNGSLVLTDEASMSPIPV